MKNLALPFITLILVLINSISSAAAATCTVVHNISGLTPVSEQQELAQFTWLAFEDGKVLARGNDSPDTYLQKFKEKCQKIDGKGNFLLPGLIDAHGHVSSLGYELQRVQLRGAESEAAAVGRVKAFAKENPDTKWIQGRGWNQVLWKKSEFPVAKSLDKTGIKTPIVLNRVDGHAAWVNSAALKIAGIDDKTPDPAGGKIVRDKNGKATGVLIDNAMDLVVNKIPQPDQAELLLTFDKAFKHLLSLGIVSVHDAGVSQADLDAYQKMRADNTLNVRIYGMLSGNHPNLSQWLKAGIIKDDQDLLSIRSVKLYSDGALGSRGAALIKPYSDDPKNTGLLLTEEAALQTLVDEIIGAGFQANIHAIGDRGNHIVLDTFEKNFKTSKGRSLRNRIEHAQVVTLEDIPRFKSLDIIASMQPTHATSDKNMAGDRLGEKRLAGAYAWQKFLQQGTPIAAGSDFPVEYANPFFGLHAAITRQDNDNQPKGGWRPEDKMSLAQALRGFTLDAAYAAHQDRSMGSLEKGKWADFILIDRDLTKIDPANIWQTQVLQTWIAGDKVFQN